MPDEKPRLLLLGGQASRDTPIAGMLEQIFRVDQFHSLEEAMVALRGEPYAAVFADSGDFLPLERALVSQQASVVLDTIGEGVLVVDTDGRCAWSNKRLRGFPAEVIEKVNQICRRALAMFEAQIGSSSDHAAPRSKKFTFQAEHDRYFELISSPVLDETGKVRQVVAVVWDATRGKRLEQKINAIDAAGREVARLEGDRIAKLSPTQRLELLRDKIITFSKELMHFDHFAIRVVDAKSNKLDLVIAEGLPSEALEIDLYAQPEGNGISGYVAATGRSYICHDTEKDPRYVMGIRHCKSSLTVPLRLQDTIVGVFNIESERVGGFDEDDRQFAEIFGQYVAMALHILNLLVVERVTATGFLADNVVQEMAEPLNDIVTEAAGLKEEYIGDDQMRSRLDRIINHVESLRGTVREVASGTRTVLGSGRIQQVCQDAVLAGKRILVADDEINIRDTVTDVLRKHGCFVTPCKDGYEAVHMLEQQDYDMVLSDIKMPHRNGYEIFAAAKRRREDLPVMLMTGFGYDPHHSIVRASQEGLCAVLYKPFKVESLLDEVRKAVLPPATPDASAPGVGSGGTSKPSKSRTTGGEDA